MHKQIPVGFSQRIQLAWLEQTASGFAGGATRTEIEAQLQRILKDKVSVGGISPRGNREKIITILLKTWVTVPSHLEPLRNEAVLLWQRLPQDQRLAAHWGLIAATYPFFLVVTDALGRLLELQGRVSAAQVQRRVAEIMGERETVARAARRTIRTLVDWGVLRETAEKGLYQAASPVPLEPELSRWLIKAILWAEGKPAATFSSLIANPGLYPFKLAITPYDLKTDSQLEITRQGLNEDIILLK